MAKKDGNAGGLVPLGELKPGDRFETRDGVEGEVLARKSADRIEVEMKSPAGDWVEARGARLKVRPLAKAMQEAGDTAAEAFAAELTAELAAIDAKGEAKDEAAAPNEPEFWIDWEGDLVEQRDGRIRWLTFDGNFAGGGSGPWFEIAAARRVLVDARPATPADLAEFLAKHPELAELAPELASFAKGHAGIEEASRATHALVAELPDEPRRWTWRDHAVAATVFVVTFGIGWAIGAAIKAIARALS